MFFPHIFQIAPSNWQVDLEMDNAVDEAVILDKAGYNKIHNLKPKNMPRLLSLSVLS